MSFELLDDVLLESGYNKPVEEEEVVNTEDNDIFEELDGMIEGAMRESLRNTVFCSENESDIKLEHLEVVESAEFTEEQMTKFMDTTIYPILEMSGSLEDNDNETVSLPLFEIVGLLEDLGSDEITEENADIELEAICEFYGINDEDRETIIAEATELLESHGIDKLDPSMQDVSLLVCETIVILGEVDTSENLEEAKKKGGRPTKKQVKMRILRGQIKDAPGKALAYSKEKIKAGAAKVKEKGKEAGKWATAKGKVGLAKGKAVLGTKKGKIIAGAITMAAVAAAAALAYRRKGDKCKGLDGDAKSKCKAAAVNDAIKALNKQKSQCSKAKNPAKCAAGVDKQIAKWKGRMAA